MVHWRVCSGELYISLVYSFPVIPLLHAIEYSLYTGILLLLVVVPLLICFFIVVLFCYRYLRDKLVATTSPPNGYTLVKTVE